MADFHDTIKAHQGSDLTTEESKKAGQPVAGTMDDAPKNYLKDLIKLIESGEIDPNDQNTFLVEEIYKDLPEEWREKTDLALLNIANQIRLIYDFYTHNETPEESPQLQTMIEHLWDMKQRIEEHHDVFKF